MRNQIDFSHSVEMETRRLILFLCTAAAYYALSTHNPLQTVENGTGMNQRKNF